jgi:hypothetical protein
VRVRKGEDGEAIGKILLSPSSEVGLSYRIGFDESLESFFGVGAVVGVENESDTFGDLGLDVLFSDGLLSGLLRMELAMLTRSFVQGGLESEEAPDVEWDFWRDGRRFTQKSAGRERNKSDVSQGESGLFPLGDA